VKANPITAVFRQFALARTIAENLSCRFDKASAATDLESVEIMRVISWQCRIGKLVCRSSTDSGHCDNLRRLRDWEVPTYQRSREGAAIASAREGGRL
jgi:hypothetical protein